MPKSARDSIINRIENELLLKLIDYVLPFADNKINKKESKKHPINLELIVNNTKPKISLGDIKALESVLLNDVHKNTGIKKNVRLSSKNIFYSLSFIRKKEDKKSNNYSVTVNYDENSSEDKLKISIKNAEEKVYSTEIINSKDAKDKIIPYSFAIAYEDKHGEERLSITYKQQLKNYIKQHIHDKEDMTNRVPLKWLNILPENIMGGVLGFTYLGENFMGRRADLTGQTARMVDIHESIHTPDEYETRVLTSWIMEKSRGKYVK